MKISLRGETVCYGTGGGRNGDKQGAENIVFVHGAGFDHSVWVMPARYFARHGCHVVAPDLPGHGGSTGTPLASINDMAAWLAELIRATCNNPVSVVGHSMGALVALALTASNAELVQRMVLLGTAYPMPVGPPLLQAAADNHHAAIDMANTWSHSDAAGLGATQNPGMNNYYSGQRWMERLSAGVYHADLQACNSYQADFYQADGQADSAAMANAPPTLIIAGSKDKMTPARSGAKLAEQIPGAQLLQLPGSGHAMMSEQPNAVLDALANFILRAEV